MRLSKRSSFLIGFVAALLLIAAVWMWLNLSATGGVIQDSPNGVYTVVAVGPLSPQAGGQYVLHLRHKASGRELCTASYTLPATKETVALRGGGGAIRWDAGNTYAELLVGGQPVVRIWVP